MVLIGYLIIGFLIATILYIEHYAAHPEEADKLDLVIASFITMLWPLALYDIYKARK